MPKRPSLFAEKKPIADQLAAAVVPEATTSTAEVATKRPPSRVGKRVVSTYLDPIAWRQLRELALDLETSTQALGEEAFNLLFEKHQRNRSA